MVTFSMCNKTFPIFIVYYLQFAAKIKLNKPLFFVDFISLLIEKKSIIRKALASTSSSDWHETIHSKQSFVIISVGGFHPTNIKAMLWHLLPLVFDRGRGESKNTVGMVLTVLLGQQNALHCV